MDDLPPLGAPGARLGRYELLQRIAVGGMAEVYRASAVGPGDFRKLVAVKRLLPQHALDPQLLRMFLDESRLMARFAHPNLPHVLDVNDGGGTEVPFFVMEHVAGVDLREVMQAAAGPLPLEQVVALASGVAAGLHHAHELRADDGQPLQIVHRDVSPSNVLVSFDGGVKVTDFGVAKWLQQKSFTYQGQLKGKFAHMSPEQCRGEPLDRRSDIFALGTLLYEMATGHPPFQADSEFELLSQIVSRDAPWPRGANSELAPELAAVIVRSLRRNRDERFATAQEVQLALESFAREQRLVVSPVGLAAYVEPLFRVRVAAWRSSAGSNRGEPVTEPGASLAVARTATDTFALEATMVSKGEPVPEAAGTEEPARGPRPRGRTLATAGALVVAVGLAFGGYRASRVQGRGAGTGGGATHHSDGTQRPPAAERDDGAKEPPPPPASAAALLAKSETAAAPGASGTPLPTAVLPAGVPRESPRGAPAHVTAGLSRPGRARRASREIARMAADPAPAVGAGKESPASPAAPEDSARPRPVPPAPSPSQRAPQTKVWDPDSPVPP